MTEKDPVIMNHRFMEVIIFICMGLLYHQHQGTGTANH